MLSLLLLAAALVAPPQTVLIPKGYEGHYRVIVYNVKWGGELSEDDCAQTWGAERTIYIAEDRDRECANVADSLQHEIWHAIHYENNADDKGTKEQFIRDTSPAYVWVLRNNPTVWYFILHGK